MKTTTQTQKKPAEFFREEQLPFPPVAAELGKALIPAGPNAWTTRQDDSLPLDLDRRAREVREGVADFAELGFTGHGVNSWLMYFNQLHGPLALFIQCRWGNAYDDEARARRRMEGVMALADKLTKLVADASDILPAGERLIVCFSDHFPSRWQWRSDGDEWNVDGDFTLLAACQALLDRLKAAGRGA